MERSFEHEYPPASWDATALAEVLRTASGAASTPDYEDAAFWADVREHDRLGAITDRILDSASAAVDESVPPVPASDYLDFVRTGDRTAYQEKLATRLRRLTWFTLAECLEREGRYLDPILDYAWAVCEEATWVLPAHLEPEHAREGLPADVPPERRTLALRGCETALLLAEVDHLLGDRLHPELRARIRREADEQVFRPYEVRDDVWWMTDRPAMNWTAVCNGTVATAATHLVDDTERLAGILTKATRGLGPYLAGFDADGCTCEGVLYWAYGVENYVTLAAALEARTDGAYSLRSPPVVEALARFPSRVELSPGYWVPFSDSVAELDRPTGSYTPRWLGRRLDDPALFETGRRLLNDDAVFSLLPGLLRTLAWYDDAVGDTEDAGGDAAGVTRSSTPAAPAPADYFGGHQWWVARADPENPTGVVVAAKGGSNDEFHNHNDCGSFVFHTDGESPLTDLGKPEYDRDYFQGGRYGYLSARSLGHSVPFVNGYEQAAGAEHAARVVERSATATRETFVLDIADAYPEEAGLRSLRRRFTLDRATGADGAGDATFTVEDRPVFEASVDAPAWESVLVSYLPMQTEGGTLRVDGETGTTTVTAECDGVEGGTEVAVDVTVERLPDAMADRRPADYYADAPPRDVWRARLTPPAGADSLRLVVEYEPSAGAD